MKILVGVDTSDASQVAARAIAARPWPAGTSVEVLSVVDSAYQWDLLGLADRVESSACDAARCAADDLQRAGLRTDQLVLWGDPKSVLVDRAEHMQADWIVVGAHERPGLAGFLLGSVARAVVRHAPCSVEIVRARAGREPGPMKVLLATDGSEDSEHAARSIAARPWPAGTEFRVLSVAELPAAWFRTPYPPYFDPKAMEDLRAEAMQKAQDALSKSEEILTEAGLPESATVAVPSSATKEIILTEAVDWGADLIVVGSHGRGAATRFLLGSVSESVAFHADCSVEIVRRRARHLPEDPNPPVPRVD